MAALRSAMIWWLVQRVPRRVSALLCGYGFAPRLLVSNCRRIIDGDVGNDLCIWPPLWPI